MPRPIHDASGGVPVPSDHSLVARPGVQVAERNDEHEWTGEVRVVRGVRIDIQERQRTATDLIRDAAGLFVTPGIDAIGLESTEPCQAGIERLAAINPRRLRSGRERVTSEEGRIQGHAGLKREPFIGSTLEQRERAEVADVRRKNALDLAVGWRCESSEMVAPIAEHLLALRNIVGGN